MQNYIDRFDGNLGIKRKEKKMEWHEVLGNYATAGELVAAYRQRGVTDDDLAAAIEADWREFTHPAEIDETNLPHFEEVAHDLLRCYEEELQRVRGGEK